MSAADQPVTLFAKQRRIYPKRVWGTYRKVKWWIMAVTLGVYYGAPWLRWDRGPLAPDQAILIDMPNRRAYFFFIEIWPQEVYYLTGLLILGAVALFFATSLFGRVWCGYTCPQTVWTDLFVWVERIVQGDRNARMKLDKARLSFEKIWKKGLTHFIWLVIGLCTGGAWVFYFNDAPTLFDQIAHLDVPAAVWGWMLALTFSTYLMAGYAREQVCTYMCPYSRFQSAMFDKDSLVISYDEARGEARGKHKAGESWENRGHCIDCTACVQVCPMGIDIRDGLQMECIACGMCVDACNNIMDKLELPRGLVRYDTARNMELRARGESPVLRLLRPQTIYYTVILAVVGSVMLFSLLTRSPVELHALHDRNPLFVTLSDGHIRNGYDITILNKSHEDAEFSLSMTGIDGAETRFQGVGEINPEKLVVFAGKVGHFRLFVTAEKQKEMRKMISFSVTNNVTGVTDDVESIFVSGKVQ